MADFEKAHWGIPHCNYKKTPEGFVVDYVTPRPFSPARISVLTLSALPLTIAAIAGGYYLGTLTTSFIVGFAVFFAILGVGFVYGVRWGVGKLHTVIEVTKDAVIIDGKKLRRSIFPGFRVASSRDIPGSAFVSGVTAVRLGYRYGNQRFEFGGMCAQGPAEEFVTGLNRELELTLEENDKNNPSPEALRSARPTDF